MQVDPVIVESKLLSRLSRLGVKDWREVLLCIPKGFLDYSQITPLQTAMQASESGDSRHLLRLAISASYCWQTSKRIILTATDGLYSVRLVIFDVNGPDIAKWKALVPGDIVHLVGSIRYWEGNPQIAGPALVSSALVGRILPVYEKKRGVVADGAIFDATRFALANHLQETVAYLVGCYHGMTEQEIIAQTRLKARSIELVLRAAHEPSSEENGARGLTAMRRLAALSVVENAKRLKIRSPMPESVIRIPAAILNELEEMLPYPLTGDQLDVVKDIVRDLASPVPMRRVLSGDVGCGKTLPLLIVAVAVQRLGRSSVILTPNALLADQLANECMKFFGSRAKIQVVTSASQKPDLADNPILVGTTALISRLKDFPPVDFYAVDEQQKFSVGQKAMLASIRSNFIEATATPIPRTTALITHGALDISIIRQQPVKKTIITKIVHAQDAKRLFSHTCKVLEGSGQIAVVLPIVRDSEQEKKSVTSAFETWNNLFPGQVAMVHGQMKESDKLQAVNGLKRGDQQIAIVSSVIELGLTLGRLRSVVVVNAERYGTSTLHQLRGRVARNGGIGYFFLFLPDPVSADTLKRMKLLEDHSDGFTLSERDAELRGYGDLFENAERQSGASRSTVFHCVDLTPTDIHRVTAPQAIAA